MLTLMEARQIGKMSDYMGSDEHPAVRRYDIDNMEMIFVMWSNTM